MFFMTVKYALNRARIAARGEEERREGAGEDRPGPSELQLCR